MNSTQTAGAVQEAAAKVIYYRQQLAAAVTRKQVVEADEQLTFWTGRRVMLERRLS